MDVEKDLNLLFVVHRNMPTIDANIPMYSITDNKYFIDVMNENIFQMGPSTIHPMCKLNKTTSVTKNNKTYYLLRYNKNLLIRELIPELGLFRSVILNHKNQVVSFSPPKSIPSEKFIEKYPSIKNSSIICEEFVEGTMINIFWEESIGLTGSWEISTRNTVGAENLYVTNSGKTYREMFLDACKSCQLELNTLEKNYCYSFVLQHPENKMIVPFKDADLYLVEVYKIVNCDNNQSTIFPQSRSYIQSLVPSNVKLPELYTQCETYSELIDLYASMNTSYKVLGVVIKNISTGERCKIRNPVHEQLIQLRENQPKLQYQYLCLRKEGKIGEYITFYPEHKEYFSSFRDQIHLFTKTLHKNYVSCYIKKEELLGNFPQQYRVHIQNLHRIYRTDIKDKKKYINITTVINYVNDLHPSQLMFYLNYNMRKRALDFIQTDHKICF